MYRSVKCHAQERTKGYPTYQTKDHTENQTRKSDWEIRPQKRPDQTRPTQKSQIVAAAHHPGPPTPTSDVHGAVSRRPSPKKFGGV